MDPLNDGLFCHGHVAVICHVEESVTYPGGEGNGNDDGVEEIWTENAGYTEEKLSEIWGGKAVKINFSGTTFLWFCFLKFGAFELVNNSSVVMLFIRPFPSCCEPHYDSEAKVKAFHMKISFVCI